MAFGGPDRFLHERIRQLFSAGWTPEAIGGEVGCCVGTVRRALRNAGLMEHETVNPLIGYRLPPADEGELTPFQRLEREASRRRAFEVAADFSMTEDSARRAVGMSTLTLAERDGMTTADARYVRGLAFRFLTRLAIARAEGTEEIG